MPPFECVRFFPPWRRDALTLGEDPPSTTTGSHTTNDEDDNQHDDDVTRPTNNDDRLGDHTVEAVVEAPTKARILLLDVIGGRGLCPRSKKARTRVDPYCVVRVAGRLVHQTSAVPNDPNPIWTVESSSLCLLELGRPQGNGADEDETVTIEVRSGSELLFEPVRLSAGEMVALAESKEGVHRRDVALRPPDTKEAAIETPAPAIGGASLSVQFRLASARDAHVLDRVYRNNKALPRHNEGAPPAVAVDWTFVRESAAAMDLSRVRQPSVRKRPRTNTKEGTATAPLGHELVFRVQPGPYPRRRTETEWLTNDEIQREYLKPSTLWHSSVTSERSPRDDDASFVAPSHGTIKLEVLGCDHLPRLDVTGRSDPFCAILYENQLLRTDVIWNCQCPRWMPWTSRAFELPIRHPYSLLFVAALDYDASPILDSSIINSHDPIGRIVLHPSRFEPNVTHVLSYRLDGDGQDHISTARSSSVHDAEDSKACTIRIRLRVCWRGGAAVPPVALAAPPRRVLHVRSDRSFRVLRYLARGSVDMDQPSVASVRAYGEELVAYARDYGYLLDVLFEIFLWRGRARVLGRSVWFPIQSIAWFGALCLCLEYPKKAPAVLLYGICWILMSTQYHASRQPNPWRRVKALDQRLRSIVFQSTATVIPPNAGVAEDRRLRRLDAIKGQRMGRLSYQSLMFCLSVYRIYSKTSAPLLVTEPRDWSLLSGRLYYLHMFLHYLCTYIRSFKNFAHWRAGSSTQRFAGYCLLLATVWAVLPVDRVARWAIRVWVWTVWGPWMELVDILWVKNWYRTKEQLLDAIDAGDAVNDEEIASQDVPDFDTWLRSDVFVRMGHRGRLAAEEACKQRAWRRALLGTYSERVPSVDSSRYPSTPLPSSFSRAELVEAAEEDIVFIPPQELLGTMVPTLVHEVE